MATGDLLALDLARVTGYLWAPPGTISAPTFITTYDTGRSIEDGVDALAKWLRDKIEARGIPAAIVVEAALHPTAAARAGNGGDSIKLQQQYHGAVRAIACCYGVRYMTPHPSTVRKEFCGRANANERGKTKNMVIACAQAWGYMAEDERNDNAADAAACHFWGSIELGFGQQLFRLR